MPYVFVEIEKQKNWVIKLVFIFLAVLYFLIAEIIWIVTKIFLFSESIFSPIIPKHLFSPGEFLFVSILACVIAIIHWYCSTQNMINKILDLLAAIEPDTKDSYHQVFKNVVEEVSVATGGTYIRPYVISSLAMNAFSISDTGGNAVIGVTEGLLARLNRSQLEGVVAHEAAHIASGDSLTTTITCSLFGVYSAMLEKISETLSGNRNRSRSRSDGREMVFLVVIYVVVSFAQFINLLLNMFLSRQKESRADAVAVRLVRNPLSLAEALYLISRGWRGVGGISDSLAPLFIMSPEYSSMEENEGFISDLFSTHPPVKSRLSVLLGMAHSDVAGLKDGIRPKQRISVQDGVIELEKEPVSRWRIFKDNVWSGPFPIEELFNLGLTPNSWVSRLGEDAVKLAMDDSGLIKAFREGLSDKEISQTDNCPECRQPLGEAIYEGAPLLKCHYCAGFFASESVISRIIIRDDFRFEEAIKESAETALKSYPKGMLQGCFKVKFTLNCPRCNEEMKRGLFSYAYPIEVDRCWKCRYIWLKKSELEIIQCLSDKFAQGDNS